MKRIEIDFRRRRFDPAHDFCEPVCDGLDGCRESDISMLSTVAGVGLLYRVVRSSSRWGDCIL